MGRLEELISKIQPPDEAAMTAAKERQARLAKPPGSLGRLESLSVQLAGITGRVHNSIGKKELLVFAADNGVVEEKVSSAPQSVTLQQSINLTRGKTGAAVLARHFNCALTVCDVGINAEVNCGDILDRKIAFGTNNIAIGPAMTRAQAETAVITGFELARASEADVLGVGEMGIGNTTTASAVLSVLLAKDAEGLTGRGGGISEEAFERKKNVIRRAIALNHPDQRDVLDVLAKVGGLDIAAMCGAFLGAAAAEKPVVIDGFISAVAALCAFRLCPQVKDYLIPSHASFEPGYALAMEALGLEPLLLLDMRLGEGSGCPPAMELLSAACSVMNNMASFEEAGIRDDYLDEIRRGDCFSTRPKERAWEDLS